MTQSEYALEEALIAQLKSMEYSFVRIDNEARVAAISFSVIAEDDLSNFSAR